MLFFSQWTTGSSSVGRVMVRMAVFVAIFTLLAACSDNAANSISSTPEAPGVQPITHCESVVPNTPQDRLDPPDNAINITIYFSGEECQYLPQIALDFNRSYINRINPITNQPLAEDERPIFVTGRQMSSGTVFDGLIRELNGFGSDEFVPPTIWSPSSSHFLIILNEEMGREVFDLSEARATALAPVVIAIWESRLEAIRNTVGYEDIGWEELLGVLNSPNGWCDYGITECRTAVYYGHTNPNFSPTGLSTLIAEYYASARLNGFDGRVLTMNEISNAEIVQGVRDIESLIRHYSRRTTEFKHYIAQGPDYVDFVALEENDVITINRGLTEYTPPERLIALYPKEGTFWHEHPFGIPRAVWVSQEQRNAARVFTDYVLTPGVQSYIVTEGFRPVNPSVPLAFPFDSSNGVTPEGPTEIMNLPSGEVILAIKDSWSLVKKRADIILLIDVSGSMGDDNKLSLAQQAASEFVGLVAQIDPGNRVGLSTFNDEVENLVPLDIVEANRSQMLSAINSLRADDGTSLFDAIISVGDEMNRIEETDRIRIVILLSDGKNSTGSATNLNEALQAIQASAQSRNPVIVIPIAYGDDADIQTLLRIAEASKTQLQDASKIDVINTILNLIASMS